MLPDQVRAAGALPLGGGARARPSRRREVLVRPVRITDERAAAGAASTGSPTRASTGASCATRGRTPTRRCRSSSTSTTSRTWRWWRACARRRTSWSGMARYDVDPATRLADVAFVVRDDWQGRGVGTALMRRMREVARARGLPASRPTCWRRTSPCSTSSTRAGSPCEPAWRTALSPGVLFSGGRSLSPGGPAHGGRTRIGGVERPRVVAKAGAHGGRKSPAGSAEGAAPAPPRLGQRPGRGVSPPVRRWAYRQGPGSDIGGAGGWWQVRRPAQRARAVGAHVHPRFVIVLGAVAAVVGEELLQRRWRPVGAEDVLVEQRRCRCNPWRRSEQSGSTGRTRAYPGTSAACPGRPRRTPGRLPL